MTIIYAIFASLLYPLQPFQIISPLLLLEFHLILVLKKNLPLLSAKLLNIRFTQRFEWWELVLFMLIFSIGIKEIN
jgi:hypothetical protein